MRDVVVRVRRPERSVEAIRRPSGERLPLAIDGTMLAMTIAELDRSWDIVELPGYFAGSGGMPSP